MRNTWKQVKQIEKERTDVNFGAKNWRQGCGRLSRRFTWPCSWDHPSLSCESRVTCLMKLRLDPGRSGDCSDWVVPSGWFLWLTDSEANLVLIYRGKELTSSWAMTLTAMSPRLVLVLTVHAVTHCDDSVDHCCTNAGCFCCACCESVVLCRTAAAAAAWFFIWLRLAFLCLFFFLCASRNLTSLRKLSSILICHANCVRPNMPSLTIQQRIEASFRSWSFFPDTHTNSWCFCINITSDLERSGTKFRSMAKAVSAVYSHEMRCISFDSPSCWLSQHDLTTCPRTRSVKRFHLSFFVILSIFFFFDLLASHRLTVLPGLAELSFS